MKKDKKEDIKSILERLIFDANRVSQKFGHDDSGTPSDYTEWTDLRNSIQKAKGILNA